MTNILACVDASSYAPSVCDHAAWLAERMEAEITLLHVDEQASDARVGGQVLRHASERLSEHGVEEARRLLLPGEFRSEARRVGDEYDLVVAGKRGVRSDRRRRQLGESVNDLLRSLVQPICLVSKFFLPINRALVLLDSDSSHRRAGEFVASHPALRELEMDLVMMTQAKDEGAEKLEWVRKSLGAANATLVPLAASSPHHAATVYLEDRGADMLIISREMLLSQPPTAVLNAEADSFWRLRTPVLIC